MTTPNERLLAAIVAALLAAGCDPQKQPAPAASGRPPPPSSSAPPAPPSASAPRSTPLSRLVPRPRPGPRALCPLEIAPGEAFGPISLGETLEDLRSAGLIVAPTSSGTAEVTVATGKGAKYPLHVALCGDKIVDVWLEDLRRAPACVTYQGKPVAPNIALAKFVERAGPCVTEPRLGGTSEVCEQGGMYLTHGGGTYLQIRIMPKGVPLDQTCELANDDGSPVELPVEERQALLKEALGLRRFAPHWREDLPGRRPMRVIETPLLTGATWEMFGAPISWIKRDEARPGESYLEVKRLEASKAKAVISFEYPAEGLTGTVTFHRAGELWAVGKIESSR